MLRRITDFIGREPVICAAFLAAVIACATSFGLHWSADQVGGVEALWAAFSAFFVRSVVTPMASLPRPGAVTPPPPG